MAAAGVTRRRLLKIFVVLLFAGVALRGLSALLLGMHVSGADPHSWSSLTPLRHPGGLVASAEGVIKGWQSYALVETPGVANAWDVVQWGMAVDILLFAPMYALGLFLFIAHPRPAANSLAVNLGLAATVIAFIADELENVLTLTVVGLGWHGRYGPEFTAATWGLWTFSWLKWIAATIAVIVAALLAVPLVRSALSSWRANAKRLHVLRLHLVLVAFAAVLFFTHEQIPDLVRRWTPVTLAVTTALALGFALLIWAATRRLLTVALWSLPTRKDPEERKLELKILRVLVIVAFVQVGLHVLFHGEWDPGWGLAVPAVLLGVVALAGLVVDADDPPERDAEPLVTGREPRLPRVLASVLAIAFALGVFDASFGYAVYVHSLAWQALIIPVGAALGIGVWRIVKRYGHLAWGAAGGFAGAIVLAIVRGGQLQPLVLVLAALLLAVFGWLLYDVLAGAKTADDELSRTALALAVVVVLSIGFGVIWKTIWVGEHLGAVGVLFGFLLAAALVVSLIAWAAPGIPVPRFFRALNAKTFPILTLLLVWFALASNFDQGGYHDARVLDSPRAANGATLEEVFACWLTKNGLKATEPCGQEGSALIGAQGAAGATPLIMVATTGGGIRAAYWTSLVLDCALESTTCPHGPRTKDFTNSDRLFGVSGISGGSLGLASYAAYLIDKREGTAANNWVSNALHVDALSGAGAWWLFTELPRSFLQFNVPDDRAAVQEKGWEGRWPHGELGRGIFDVWHSEPQVPLLLLNGTSVTDGCRFEASALDGNVERIASADSTETDAAKAEFAGCRSTEPFDESSTGSGVDLGSLDSTRVAPESVLPGTKDLVDYLCHRNFDVPLSTAALLSARFPFVNPSGRVPRKCETQSFRAPVAYVVDGGYLDTSGASPILELMQPLGTMIGKWNDAHRADKQCIVPLMIQIDNGFDPGAAHEARPKELLVPSGTLSAARLGRAAEARSGTALLFDSATATFSPVNRYAHFVNQVHAGPHAPLGWAQSEFSEHELESQLRQPANQQAFKEVRRWLAPGVLSCASGARP